MIEALKIIEAERQKFKRALEEIGAMSLNDKSGQAVVVTKAALESCLFACYALGAPSLSRNGRTKDCPSTQAECSVRSSYGNCHMWRKVES